MLAPHHWDRLSKRYAGLNNPTLKRTFSGNRSNYSLFWSKKEPLQAQDFSSKRPISLLQGGELEPPQGNREVPRTAKRLIKSQDSQQVH